MIPGSERSPGKENGTCTPVLLPGEAHGQGSLAGSSPWGCKESVTNTHTHTIFKVQISYTVFTRLVYASPKDNPAFFIDAQIFYFHILQPELMFIERC